MILRSDKDEGNKKERPQLKDLKKWNYLKIKGVAKKKDLNERNGLKKGDSLKMNDLNNITTSK